mgnify:CR=1 FL=1
MTQPGVQALIRTLCHDFAGDPALQHALLRARTVEDVFAAVSEGMDAAVDLAEAAAARPGSGDVALANARNATAARQRAVRRIVRGEIHADPADSPAGSPALRLVTSTP